MTALDKYALLEAEAVWFDGMTSVPHEVIVRFGETTLTLLTFQDEPVQHWALASLRQISSTRDGGGREELRIAPGHDGEERLTLTDPEMIRALRQVCPDLLAKPKPSRRGIGRGLLVAALALGAVAGLVFVVAPGAADRLAELTPPARAARLGEASAEAAARRYAGRALADAQCRAPEGRRALDALLARLRRGAPDAPAFSVAVLRAPGVNALALPGGRILLFSGMIDAARTPEELAGVLAHELAHVEAKDPLRESYRAAGTTAVLGMLAGDLAGGAAAAAMANAALSGAYRMEAETAADARALAMLAAAGLPSSPLGAVFDRLAAEGGGRDAVHFATHPDLRARAGAARAADAVGTGAFDPALEDSDWLALQQICD